MTEAGIIIKQGLISNALVTVRRRQVGSSFWGYYSCPYSCLILEGGGERLSFLQHFFNTRVTFILCGWAQHCVRTSLGVLYPGPPIATLGPRIWRSPLEGLGEFVPKDPYIRGGKPSRAHDIRGIYTCLYVSIVFLHTCGRAKGAYCVSTHATLATTVFALNGTLPLKR